SSKAIKRMFWQAVSSFIAPVLRRPVETTPRKPTSESRIAMSDGAFEIIWTKYLLQWVAEPMQAMREFARVLKPGGLLVSANFDGFAVTNEPPDPAIQPMLEFVFNGLVDPFIGRKMAGMCRDCGLIDVDVKMEADRVFTVIGKIDPERRRNWEI